MQKPKPPPRKYLDRWYEESKAAIKQAEIQRFLKEL